MGDFNNYAFKESTLFQQADEKMQDNCDLYRCKVSETGDFVSEKRITVCMSFDEEECRNGGVSDSRGSMSSND